MISNFDRALSLEPRLRLIVKMVDAICTLRRNTDTMCCGCVWDEVLKPLARPLICWGRGYHPRVADDDEPESRIHWANELPDRPRVRATTENEKWLRSSEAWDAFTGELLRRLDKADPGNGHGIARAIR